MTLILHSLSLSSSSFVEEEHQTWYFFTLTAFSLLFVNHLKKNNPVGAVSNSIRKETIEIVMLVGLLRITQRWNSSGDKWAHLPDIGDWLNE